MAWEVFTRVYLNVPFAEKDEAKVLGAKWDVEKKSWYCNENEQKKFSKWLEEKQMTLSDLSEEQRTMIGFARQGYNVLVDACIGSGKTTSIQVMCNEFSDKKILYLTYNTLLKIDAKDKIKGRNVTTTNYHGFAYMCLAKANISAGISDLIQTFLKNKNKIAVPEYDLLVIDEYQDIEQEIAEMLECIKNANPNIQIIAVGDMAQKIYDKTTLNVPSFINRFLGEYQSVNFTKCFRLCASLASRLGNIWGKEINGVNNKCKVETMERSDVVFFLAKQKPSDILCLGSRTGGMAKVLNILEEQHPDKFNKETVYASIRESDNKTTPDKSNAIFTTFDSSKGLERKICVVFDYTEDYWFTRMDYPDTNYEVLRNIFCVAMSRGKERIIVVKEPTKTALKDKVVATPVPVKGEYDRPFYISEMFDFKYKEDVEECYNLIEKKKKHIKGSIPIEVNRNDALIDISPCIGVLQEASFFATYDIDEAIEYAIEKHDNRPPISLKKNATLEDKVLYLTAYETFQDRYIRQVKTPIIDSDALSAIHDRLGKVFSPNEEVQVGCELDFTDGLGNWLSLEGKCDVIKDNVVYELKFVSELSHEHYLQCACYMLALGLKKGVLWNIYDNTQYVITIPDRKKFFKAVVKTITKGRITTGSTCDSLLRAM